MEPLEWKSISDCIGSGKAQETGSMDTKVCGMKRNVRSKVVPIFRNNLSICNQNPTSLYWSGFDCKLIGCRAFRSKKTIEAIQPQFHHVHKDQTGCRSAVVAGQQQQQCTINAVKVKRLIQ